MWKMWKIQRSSPANTRFMVKNSWVFHNFDCGDCGKLGLSFSVLLIKKRRFLSFFHFHVFVKTARFFYRFGRCILYELFCAHIQKSF